MGVFRARSQPSDSSRVHASGRSQTACAVTAGGGTGWPGCASGPLCGSMSAGDRRRPHDGRGRDGVRRRFFVVDLPRGGRGAHVLAVREQRAPVRRRFEPGGVRQDPPVPAGGRDLPANPVRATECHAGPAAPHALTGSGRVRRRTRVVHGPERAGGAQGLRHHAADAGQLPASGLGGITGGAVVHRCRSRIARHSRSTDTGSWAGRLARKSTLAARQAVVLRGYRQLRVINGAACSVIDSCPLRNGLLAQVIDTCPCCGPGALLRTSTVARPLHGSRGRFLSMS
jgi:hypothetical protein